MASNSPSNDTTPEGQSESEACIIVAGKPKVGKSTAINNLLNLDIKTSSSPTSCTKTIKEHTKQVDYEGERVQVTIVDTPGLAALDIDMDKTSVELKGYVEDKDYILLYCIPITPGTTLDESDLKIAQCLQDILGKDIWKRCILLFTFSDICRLAKYRCKNEDEKYIQHINEKAQYFHHEILTKCDAPVLGVRSIFQLDTNNESDHIVAIPAEEGKRGASRILPGFQEIDGREADWTDYLFKEMLKIGRAHNFSDSSISALMLVRYFATHAAHRGVEAIKQSAEGVKVGAGVGAVAGYVAAILLEKAGIHAALVLSTSAIPGLQICVGAGILTIAAGGLAGGAIGGAATAAVAIPVNIFNLLRDLIEDREGETN